MNITTQLADALRACVAARDTPTPNGQMDAQRDAMMDAAADARRLLAAYDAQQQSAPATADDIAPLMVGKMRRNGYDIDREDGHNIAEGVTSENKARRIVACVNACAGIDTEALEGAWMVPKFGADGYYRLERAEPIEGGSPYAARVRQLEAEGMTTSDAQAVADTEGLDD